jgi:magnesium chelatase family protein
MNPCPCGWLGAYDATGRSCRCTPDQIARYQGRISGPLLDRIDMQVEVAAVKPASMLSEPDGEPSAQIASRVAFARQRQIARQGIVNAQLGVGHIDTHCALDAAASRFAEQAAQRLGWSGRSLHRVLKLARTIADLGDLSKIAIPQLAEAMQLRRGLPGQ